jgi:sensor histidine kinase YesM
LNFTVKKTVSRRTLLVYGIISILITAISVFILSNLITQITEKSNEEMALRNFFKKQELVSQEFSKFLDQEKQIKQLLKINHPKELYSNLMTLSSIQATDSLVTSNWFQINDDKVQFVKNSNSAPLQSNINTFLQKNGHLDQLSTITLEQKKWVWRNYFKLISKNKTSVRYGFDVNLKLLHNYFSTIDESAPNYVFVFDKNGTCIFHPDASFIGKNMFKVSSLNALDTISNKEKDYAKRISLSEYLKLDVIRFTKKIEVEGSQWYISVNFPKIFADENVNLVKKYASLIYLITTVMLLFTFYLFARANRSAFLEKELLTKEKNSLFLENEKIIKEKALIQLQQLKEQINPHFLFNSLNSLYMLIDSDGKTARKFTLNLSRIYRYLIDPPEENIVSLKEELLFIEKYIFLQQTRFKDELFFSITIEDESALNKSIPYLSFQIVVENAIKHNLATPEKPLHTQIIIKENLVIITNNLQKKQNTEPSTKFGLNYLRSIYNYYSKNDFEALEKGGSYICILPLIDIHS